MNSAHPSVCYEPPHHGADKHAHHSPRHWLMHLVCLLPLVIFLLAALLGVTIPAWVVPLVIAMCVAAMLWMMSICGRAASGEQDAPTPTAEKGPEPDAGIKTADLLRPTARHRFAQAVVIEGQLLRDPEQAYAELDRRFEDTDTVPILQEGARGQSAMVLLPRWSIQARGRERPVWIHAALFLATILTTTWAGALHQGVNLLESPSRLVAGLPYSLALMVILGAHELGHYFAARAHGMKVTLPVFIPVPFALGTFGAFIQLRSPSPTRGSLFDVGVAGPLAGLVFAIPALFIGLRLSQVVPETEQQVGALHHGASLASSVLFATVAKLSMGSALSEGHIVLLHPLAFAGWLGLIVTALNLLPIGQLDGGHIADAMFGPRVSRTIALIALFALFALGLFVWSGLLIWAIIVFFIAGAKGLPPLNNVTHLTPARLAVGWFAFAILLAILTPVPRAMFDALGIDCPYI